LIQSRGVKTVGKEDTNEFINRLSTRRNQMKKVVIGSNLNQMTTDELKDDEIYAFYVEDMQTTIIISLNGSRLTDSNESNNHYKTMALYADGLHDWCYEAESLKDIIEELLHDGHEVYNFEDETEFGNWLARKDIPKPE
jgi:hypothetical protein